MMNETLKVIKERRSIRAYKPEQITKEELDAVIEAGLYGPTGKNIQDVVIVAVQDPEDLDTVKKLNAKVMGVTSDPYYGAKTIVLVFSVDAYSEEIGVLDGAAACENMLLAARSIGLASCWINRAHQMFDMPEGKELLKKWGVSETARGVASFSLGYSAEPEKAIPPRKDGRVFIIE